jgi:hypothetical protein
MTQTFNIEENVVKDLRKIRDDISNEIKNMTFEEERAYLDNLLADSKAQHNNELVKSKEG